MCPMCERPLDLEAPRVCLTCGWDVAPVEDPRVPRGVVGLHTLATLTEEIYV